jgi:hypothetical protein
MSGAVDVGTKALMFGATTGGEALLGSGAMTGIGTAMPYVGAGLLAGKALGLFNEGGMVGPLSAQYAAQGMMTEADARALMNNQPNPDELYNEIMTEAAIKEMPQPMMRPPLVVDPFNADRTYSPYDMIRPDNAPNT